MSKAKEKSRFFGKKRPKVFCSPMPDEFRLEDPRKSREAAWRWLARFGYLMRDLN
jgi:hypothetical protein